MDKGYQYEVAAYEAIGASIKHFELDCYKTEKVYVFNTPYEYRVKAMFRAQARSNPANFAHHPYYQTIAENV